MPQITLYLDDATQALLEQAATAKGVSEGQWVAELVRQYAVQDWPQDCLDFAGRFADFPLRDDMPATLPSDQARNGF
jgi:hypothetical protein